jgi:DNA-binding beta-propeller fold protein YncE
MGMKSRVRRVGATAGVVGAAGLLVSQLGGVAQADPSGSGSLASLRSTPVASVAVGGDTNPYGVAVVPLSVGNLIAGNVLVVDFNHGATPGAGSTILQVNPTTGVSSVFASGLPISGPVGVAINPLNDGVWVGNFGATDGSTSSDLLILPNGTVKANYNTQSVNNPASTYTGPRPTFDGVWGEGVSNHNGQVSFYYGTTGSGAAGSGGGQVWRIDPHPAGPANGQPVNSTYALVATGLADNATTGALPVSPANAAGPQGFTYDEATGVLYVSNDADNTITAIPDAATATGPVTGATTVPVQPGVLNGPENITLNPTTGDLLVVNAGTNTLTEIDPTTGEVQGTRILDDGAPGALFGLAATTDADGNLVVFYGDTNTNTLNVLREHHHEGADDTQG